MKSVELIFLAFGLGLDAFSVAVAFGMCQKTCPVGARLRLSLSFGTFQFLMPILGFLAGARVANVITAFDHFVVFGILSLVGVKMLVEGLRRDDARPFPDLSRGWPLLFASLATSIDALAVGFSFALLQKGVLLEALVIGIFAFSMTYLGVSFGHRVQEKAIFSRPEAFGGIVLILIGLKTFLEHL
uniref:Putative manganese efflux pump MntP n=1 Tax=Candidatus Caldatribacterium californiense TaxID=1454726 RepID=A0A7V3YKS6_9BACT